MAAAEAAAAVQRRQRTRRADGGGLAFGFFDKSKTRFFHFSWFVYMPWFPFRPVPFIVIPTLQGAYPTT
jgi:hypothetical protein